jgi:cytochrome oxidase Cu insertion factor (SCO1/SenC/PrrC family)
MVLINTSQYDGNIITPVVKPSGTLTADDGRSFNLRADTRGIVTLLYFGYTHCPDLCPLTMSNTSVAMRMLPRADQAKIRVLFVSVDPGRDTLPRLRSWLGGFDPAFIGLRGPLPEVEACSLITRPKCSRTVPITSRTRPSSRPRRPPRWRTT